MDALILSLSPEQHKKYLAIMKSEEINLDFEIGKAEFEAYRDENIKNAKNDMLNVCEKLMNFAKSDSFFSASLTKEEIDKLIPLYFSVLNDISNARKRLYSEVMVISTKINLVEKYHTAISKKYSDFLPYKAALGKNEQYQDEILRIDNEFKCEIEKALEQKTSLANELARISTICDDLIPDFFEKSSHAADSPKFKNFNDKKFFSTVSAFVEQIKNI